MQERRLDSGLRSLKLTRITWCVLLAVGNEKLVRPSDIAAFIGIDRTATSRALRQMDTAGLIQRSTGSGDRRTTTVELTDAGLTLLDEGTPMAAANNAVMNSRLNASERQELQRLLLKTRGTEDIDLPGL